MCSKIKPIKLKRGGEENIEAKSLNRTQEELRGEVSLSSQVSNPTTEVATEESMVNTLMCVGEELALQMVEQNSAPGVDSGLKNPGVMARTEILRDWSLSVTPDSVPAVVVAAKTTVALREIPVPVEVEVDKVPTVGAADGYPLDRVPGYPQGKMRRWNLRWTP